MKGIRVDIGDSIPDEVLKLVEKNAETIAGMIEGEAKSATSFSDKTGRLRGGIAKEFRDGRWIVRARAPHAHLVEFGHSGPNPAPAHPFLRPAKERVISQVK